MVAARTYPAVGRCIYCNAHTYVAEGGGLHLEHIIPHALDGELELPEASCRSCERVTGQFEQLVLRGSLWGIREHFGLRSRGKEGRPKTLPVFAVRNVGEKEQRIDIPVEDHPSMLLMLIAHEAGIFLPPDCNDHPGMGWAYNVKSIPEFLAKYKLHSFAPPALDSHSFMRMVGKIGHAFLTAEMGLGAFQPTLLDMILGNSQDFFRHIGGQTNLPASKELHEISLEEPREHEGRTYFMVRLRLFANLGAPAYMIAAGTPI
jgi:hypothetical protein